MPGTGKPLDLEYVPPNAVDPDVPLKDMMDKINDNAIIFLGAWDSGTQYYKGHVVIYSNKLYYAKTSNTDKQPNGNPAQWDLWLDGSLAPAGRSAYEEAVANGYVGNESDWLLTLKGPKGDRGTDGAPGATGPKGDTGNDGREVEMQKGSTHIQWRYVGEPSWTNLVALADIKGPKGDKGDPFTINAVDVRANRSTYDSEAAGFAFLASDESKLYIRIGASGWSSGVPFAGAGIENIYQMHDADISSPQDDEVLTYNNGVWKNKPATGGGGGGGGVDILTAWLFA